MKTYKVTRGQANSITKPKKFEGVNFNARQDINGDWFISEVEAEYCRENFGWELQEAKFVAPPLPEGLLPE